MSVSVSGNTNIVTVTQPTTQVVRVVTAGPRGPEGIQGVQGIQGLPGEGTQGVQGIAGSAGGEQGLQGIQGVQGEAGTQGAVGLQGTVGESIQGTVGIQGAEGIQGPQGIQGVGIQGLQGPAGDITGIDTGSFATTGSNTFNGDQVIYGYVTASSFEGSGRHLTNLSPSTNWNYNQEYRVGKTEQLTFSGDYVLENTYLFVEGDTTEVEYSSNKSFKKEGTIYIGGNLLVKDSYIENDGKISVGGEVILIGNSQITGTGIII
jgi:hypothetical protein